MKATGQHLSKLSGEEVLKSESSFSTSLVSCNQTDGQILSEEMPDI